MTSRTSLVAFAVLIVTTCLACGDDDTVPVDAAAAVDGGSDAGPCVELCQACSMGYCEAICTRPCPNAASTCDEFRTCIMGPPP